MIAVSLEMSDEPKVITIKDVQFKTEANVDRRFENKYRLLTGT